MAKKTNSKAQATVKTSTKPASGKAVVLASKVSFKGNVFSVTTDTVTEPGGVTSTRDVIQHNGSVIILAVDASTNPADPLILLERQYRHAAGQFLLELPFQQD
jgi:ADP-ribose pyrophosphatase